MLRRMRVGAAAAIRSYPVVILTIPVNSASRWIGKYDLGCPALSS